MKHPSRPKFSPAPTESRYGRLIVFEGPDGVGKSSLSRGLVGKLSEEGVPCEYASFPGDKAGTLGRLVYELHHNPRKFRLEKISATSLQALHIAAHLNAIEQHIVPALAEGRWVILDRYWWSTWVYGHAFSVDGPSLDAMIHLELLQWGAIRPAVVFLIERSVASENHASASQLRKLYATLFSQEKKKQAAVLIKNDQSIGEVVDGLFKTLGDLSPSVIHVRSREQIRSFHARAKEGKRKSVVGSTTSVFRRLSPARPTVVYDTYWKFAAERQEVYWRKLNGLHAPWTTDPILRQYKFTNAYRASDRVSQYLIKHVIYKGDPDPQELFFRAILFKLFNKIETWELFQSKFGTISYADYSFSAYDRVLTEALSLGDRIYSAAYIMPSGKTTYGHAKKHRNHLMLLEQMMENEAPQRIMESRSMREAFEILASYPMIGSFLAYQFVTDLNYSELTDFSEMEFVVPGPGSLDGISKCFYSRGGLSNTDIIRLVTDRQETEFERRGLKFSSLGKRQLQLIDCQNLFCEVSKYARLKHPEYPGVTGRKRIKQVYRSSRETVHYWYPPKWGINDVIYRKGGSSVLGR